MVETLVVDKILIGCIVFGGLELLLFEKILSRYIVIGGVEPLVVETLLRGDSQEFVCLIIACSWSGLF